MKLGPESQKLFHDELYRGWDQGDHVAVFGATKSGKTRLARELDEIRLRRKGSVVVFVGKLQPDRTLVEDYKGWTRWTEWKKNPSVHENRILLWPKVEKLTKSEAVPLMRRVFKDALDEISKNGRWTIHLDEGLFMCDPTGNGLALGTDIGLMYSLIRTAHGTMITLAQRPSHLPLAIYANLSYAFIGRANELGDLRRLANMDNNMSAKELQTIIKKNGKHDFTLVRLGSDVPPQQVNLAR